MISILFALVFIFGILLGFLTGLMVAIARIKQAYIHKHAIQLDHTENYYAIVSVGKRKN